MKDEYIPVILESPYAGDIDTNLHYLRACLRDCLLRGEAPFASHGLYTQPGILNDANTIERECGILAGFAWRSVCKKTVLYCDLGCSKGMMEGFVHAIHSGHVVEFRTLHPEKNGKEIVREISKKCYKHLEGEDQ